MPSPVFAPRRADAFAPAVQAGVNAVATPRAAPRTNLDRGREAAALLLFASSVYTALALASYCAYPMQPEREGPNWVGPVGASWAGVLAGGVGVVSWAVPLELMLLAWPLLKNRASIATVTRLAGDLLVALIVAALLDVAMPLATAFGALSCAGSIGELFGELLRSLFSTIGSFLIGLTAIALILIARASFSFIAWAERATRGTEVAAAKAASSARAVADAWERAADIKRQRDDELRAGDAAPRVHDHVDDDAIMVALNEATPSPPVMVVKVAADAARRDTALVLDSSRRITAGADARISPSVDEAATKTPPKRSRARKSAVVNEPAGDSREMLAAADLGEGPNVEPWNVEPSKAEPLKAEPSKAEPSNDDCTPETPATSPTRKAPRIVERRSKDVAPPRPAPAEPMAVVHALAPQGIGEVEPIFHTIDDEDADIVPTRVSSPSTRPEAPRPSAPARRIEPVALPVAARAEPPRAASPTTRARARSTAMELDESPSLPLVEELPAPADEVMFSLPEPSPEPPSPSPLEVELAPARPATPSPAPITYHAPVEAPAPRPRVAPALGAGFRLPSTDFLEPTPPSIVREGPEALVARAKELEKVLANYGVKGSVVDIHTGPTVSTFEVVPAEGTKVSKVAGLADDLALGLSCTVRIVAPIPGKSRIGFEVPNRDRIPVNLRELVEDPHFIASQVPLPVVLGRDIVGAPFFADLASMPHVIVAGATGAGKSVGLNVMLTSLLTRRTPDELRMLMIDPKVVELAPFDRIPHMLLPVVTDMKQAANALKWAVDEMERRYQLFANAGTKNITTYNVWVGRAQRGEVRAYLPPKGLSSRAPDGALVEMGAAREALPLPEKLPYIVLVVDEFADLMMQQGKEVEAAVARLAQKARAAGMHVILATQRPSVDVITGMIKANFPTRIAFRVAQRVDSRTILDEQGAEHLLGRGDMLVKLNGTNDTRRVQCPFVSEEEVQRVTDFLRLQGEPVYDESILKARDDGDDVDDEETELDSKYDEAVRVVADTRRCSTSWLQRKLGLGYNRAAKIVEVMEKRGVVGPANGSKDREVLIGSLLSEPPRRVVRTTIPFFETCARPRPSTSGPTPST